MRKIATRLATPVGYSVSVPTGHSAYGGLCDYTGEILGIPSFTVELGRGKNPLPSEALPPITEVVKRLILTLPIYL